jgi:hypothetical protein
VPRSAIGILKLWRLAMERIRLVRINVNGVIKVCASCTFCMRFLTAKYDSSIDAVHEWSEHYRNCGGENECVKVDTKLVIRL